MGQTDVVKSNAAIRDSCPRRPDGRVGPERSVDGGDGVAGLFPVADGVAVACGDNHEIAVAG